MRNILTLIVLLSIPFTVGAQEVFWKTQSVEVSVSGSGARSTYNGAFQRVVRTHHYYECGYATEPEVIVKPGTCYDLICNSDGGRSPLWDAFYNAKTRAEKASKLAKAVDGIGKVSSEALVAGGYFSTKPRSWEAFKAQINLAASRGVITPQVQTMVLSTYRAENMSKLGYASGSCYEKIYACDEVIVVRQGQYISQTCDDPTDTVFETKAVHYTFDVSNAVLLPSETEKLTVTLSGNPAEARLSSGYFNTYSMQLAENNSNSARLVIRGAGRNQVALPANSLQSVTLIPTGSTSASLQVSVSPAALPVNNSEELVVGYEVKTCSNGVLGCGLGWDKKEIYIGKITSTSTSFTIPVSISPGRKGIKMEAEVKIYKRNSIYHNANPLGRMTDKITLN